MANFDEVVDIAWSENLKPCDEIGYDHVIGMATNGIRFSIEWKGWKEHDSFTLYIQGYYLGNYYSVADAKDAADFWMDDPMRLLRIVLGLKDKFDPDKTDK